MTWSEYERKLCATNPGLANVGTKVTITGDSFIRQLSLAFHAGELHANERIEAAKHFEAIKNPTKPFNPFGSFAYLFGL